MKKTLWIARSANDNADSMHVTFDRDEAARKARYMFDLLTDRERKFNRVTIEGYIVDDDQNRTAEQLERDELPELRDPDYYEEVKA